MLKRGTQAPEFEAPLDDGGTFRLADHRGKANVVLYFYPRDFTPGCTREACAFRDNYDELRAYGAVLAGVSADDAASHAAFRERHALPFPLIADPQREIIRLYDADGIFGIMTARVTYVIDRAGVIRAALRHDFAIGRHLPEVRAALREIEGAPGN